MPEALPQNVYWAGGLILLLPLFAVILSELSLRLRRRESKMAPAVNSLLYLVLPSVALTVFLFKVAELNSDSNWIRLVETFVWFSITYTVVSVFNRMLFAYASKDTWQSRIPRLFVDLIRSLVVLICLAITMATVWDINISQLVTALGIGSIVLGLALQEPLSNLFSGILLMFEKPLQLDDWIRVGDLEGKVIETNWRAVHVKTRSQDLVVIPNAVLSRGSFRNFTRPTTLHRPKLELHFSLQDPPNRVKRILKEAARGTRKVLSSPAPVVRLINYFNPSANYHTTLMEPPATYLVQLYIEDFDNLDNILDEFMTRVWYASRRHGLKLSGTSLAERPPLTGQAVKTLPRLGISGKILPEQFLSRGTIKDYAEGERVIDIGDRLPGMFFVIHGEVEISIAETPTHFVPVSKLGRGEFFGEKLFLAGDTSDIRVTALDDLEVLILEKNVLEDLLDSSPKFARKVIRLLQERRKSFQDIG